MALVVETGTGLANAESYASVTEFKTRSDNFGFVYSTFTDTQIEQYLRKATRYMVQEYRTQWKGYRGVSTQALDWPRYGVYTDPVGYGGQNYVASDVVPDDVKNACIDLAQKAPTVPDFFPDGTQQVTEKTVGPITLKYEQGSIQRKQFDAITATLSVYLNGSGRVNVQMVRQG